MPSEDQSQSANFNRPPRIQFPGFSGEEIDLPAPPKPPDVTDQSWLVSVLPVMGIGVMAIFYVFRGITSNPDSVLIAVPMLLMAVITIAGTVFAQRTRKKDVEKRRYQDELDYIRLLERRQVSLQAAHDAQLAILENNFPSPDDWLNLALGRDNRLWERRPQDPDFSALRLGIGRMPSQVKINLPRADLDSPTLDRALTLADQYRYLENAPVIASLLEDTSMGFCGKRAAVLKMVRAIICNLAVSHAPEDFHIHLIAPQAHYEAWRWMEWLPHASASHRGGAADLIAFDTQNIRNLMGNLGQVIDERKERKGHSNIPHLLVIIDGPQLVESESVYSTILRDGAQFGASVICLVNSLENVPSDCGSVVEMLDDTRFWYARAGTSGYEVEGKQADFLSTSEADHIARALSSVVMREIGGGGRIPRRVDFLELYNVKSVDALQPKIQERWRRRIPDGNLPHAVPIGRESLAVETQILLDEKNHGPHGVLAGTTGAGKSELLQTLICAMALEHDPRLLTFLLIDFKGGATFNVFNQLPHTVGTVTNLDRSRVGRALEALRAETSWRQQFLDSMHVRDINQYHKYFAQTDVRVLDPSYKPLPHLFIIVDEFAQLAKEMPEFMRELVRTVQVGRSLGLHLLLGTQSPMDVVTDEMNANLQFRICLRVQNIEASRAMLRRPDAAYLPAGWPGRGYFQVGEQGVFKQFQTAYVGAEYEIKSADEEKPSEDMVLEVITGGGARIKLEAETNTPPPPIDAATELQDAIEIPEPYTVAKAIAETIVEYSHRTHTPWMKPLLLPPLPDLMTLSTPLSAGKIGGWNGKEWASPGTDGQNNPIPVGSAPIGLLDDVYSRTQDPLWINLTDGGRAEPTRKDGHTLVMGGPGTGKTTFLRTLAVSQALLHPPEKLNIYILSFTGAGLNEIGNLPHAETVIQGTETERVRRLFGRLIQLLNDRQSGREPAFEPLVLVLLDQYEQFRDTYRDQHLADFERLVNEGRGVGIYLAISANSPNSVPDRIRSLIQQRVALQLGDNIEYVLAVGRMSSIPDGSLPNGRGFYYDSPPLTCQISLPTNKATIVDDREALESMSALIAEMREGYLALQGIAPDKATRDNQQNPAPIRELPTRIPLKTLPRKHKVKLHDDSHIVTPLGRYDDDSLSVFTLDWQEIGPHFVVTGPPGSGKTNLLQAAVLSAAQTYSPQQLRFLLVDFNGRSLRTLEGLKHVIRRATDVLDLKFELINLQSELSAFYAESRDHDGGKAAQVPATVIIIDDYDPTSEALNTRSEILTQLRDHVRLYSDLNFHIWAGGYLERPNDPLIKQLLLRRSGFALTVRESLQKLNVRTTSLSAEAMPDGRAFLPQQNNITVIQTALVEDAAALVKEINNEIWRDAKKAAWLHPATEDQIRQQTQGLISPSRAQADTPASNGGDAAFSIEIDTAGLIEDLLVGRKDK